MKPIYSLLLFFIISKCNVFALGNEKMISMGAAYTRFNGEDGFTFFNEYNFKLGKRITAGPNLYFTRTGYFLDNKYAISYLFGVDLNIYYTVLKTEKSSVNLGPGYSYRHCDLSSQNAYFLGYSPEVVEIDRSDLTGAIVNMNYRNSVSQKWDIGLKSTWHPWGTGESLFYVGFFGGLKF